MNVLKQTKLLKYNDTLRHEVGLKAVNPFKAMKQPKFQKKVPLSNCLSKETGK